MCLCECVCTNTYTNIYIQTHTHTHVHTHTHTHTHTHVHTHTRTHTQVTVSLRRMARDEMADHVKMFELFTLLKEYALEGDFSMCNFSKACSGDGCSIAALSEVGQPISPQLCVDEVGIFTSQRPNFYLTVCSHYMLTFENFRSVHGPVDAHADSRC